jgi:hypothetical protein
VTTVALENAAAWLFVWLFVITVSRAPMNTKAGTSNGITAVIRFMIPVCVSGRYPQNSIAIWNVLTGACAM